MQDDAPTFIPILPRTRSDDLTLRMHMTDHTLTKQDGPPDMHAFDDDEPTDVDGSFDVDGIVDTEIIDADIPWTPYP